MSNTSVNTILASECCSIYRNKSLRFSRGNNLKLSSLACSCSLSLWGLIVYLSLAHSAEWKWSGTFPQVLFLFALPYQFKELLRSVIIGKCCIYWNHFWKSVGLVKPRKIKVRIHPLVLKRRKCSNSHSSHLSCSRFLSLLLTQFFLFCFFVS